MDRIDREEMTYGELTALIDGLMNDHTSHTFASAVGWAYVPSPQEVAFYDELDVKLAMNRGKNQPKPPRVKRPWEEKPVAEARHDPKRTERRELLAERLGLPN